jgi:hypothetical protein
MSKASSNTTNAILTALTLLGMQIRSGIVPNDNESRRMLESMAPDDLLAALDTVAGKLRRIRGHLEQGPPREADRTAAKSMVRTTDHLLAGLRRASSVRRGVTTESENLILLSRLSSLQSAHDVLARAVEGEEAVEVAASTETPQEETSYFDKAVAYLQELLKRGAIEFSLTPAMAPGGGATGSGIVRLVADLDLPPQPGSERVTPKLQVSVSDTIEGSGRMIVRIDLRRIESAPEETVSTDIKLRLRFMCGSHDVVEPVDVSLRLPWNSPYSCRRIISYGLDAEDLRLQDVELKAEVIAVKSSVSHEEE